MHSNSILVNWRPLPAVALAGAMLCACGSPQSTAPAPQVVQPEPVMQPEEVVQLPAVGPAAPVAGSEPELANMKVARASSSKMGVPVDLRYQIDGDAMSGQPVTVHLAAVPRVAGTNLAVSIKEDPGIEFPKQTLNAQKADAATAYRQQLQLMRKAGGPDELRVLVTMDFPIGSGFTWFTVPLGSRPGPSKQSVDRVE
jgi:hypothetical protein